MRDAWNAAPAWRPGGTRLAVVVPPFADESLPSWVKRWADELVCDEGQLLRHIGLTQATRIFAEQRIAGLSPQETEAFAVASGMDQEDVEATTLAPYAGILFEKGSQLFEMSWCSRQRIRVCDECRGSAPYYSRLAWHVSWSFACAPHRRLLSRPCSNCSSSSGDLKAQCQRCTAGVQAFEATDELIDLQVRVDALLEAAKSEASDALLQFGRLNAVITTLQYIASPLMSDEVPTGLKEQFDRFAVRRASNRTAQHRTTLPSRRPVDDPLVLASLLWLARGVLLHNSVQGIVGLLSGSLAPRTERQVLKWWEAGVRP